ncbi:MAG: hypothetical protein MMC23_002351 [Stictis urceolatum]|nr:hypothetical protein [Stictis urceolata]
MATANHMFDPSAPKPAPVLERRQPPPGRTAFATFMILCPTSFFLGILFSLFPYDYPILWTSSPASSAIDPFTNLERHLSFLHASPPLIPRILHIVIAVGLIGFFIKLFKPTESNMLFDGASLALYVIGIVIYVSNTVSGLRLVTSSGYSVISDQAARDGEKPLSREDSLKVLSASNTILALVLVGVLVLQAGQWYAERKEGQEVQKAIQERIEKKRAAAEKTGKKKN